MFLICQKFYQTYHGQTNDKGCGYCSLSGECMSVDLMRAKIVEAVSEMAQSIFHTISLTAS